VSLGRPLLSFCFLELKASETSQTINKSTSEEKVQFQLPKRRAITKNK
jgi:hypothetical protein